VVHAAGNGLMRFTWLRDKTSQALVLMLLQHGLRAVAHGRLVEISGTKLSVPELRDKLYETAAAPLSESAALLTDARNLAEEK